MIRLFIRNPFDLQRAETADAYQPKQPLARASGIAIGAAAVLAALLSHDTMTALRFGPAMALSWFISVSPASCPSTRYATWANSHRCSRSSGSASSC